MRTLVPGLCAAAFLATTGSAEAARFCVSDPACVTAGGIAHTTLQNAFNAADGNGAGLDQIEIGATTLPAGGTAGTAVEVIGEGQGQTLVDGSGGGTIITLPTSGSSVRDLSIRIDGNDGRGLYLTGPATRVTIAGASSAFEVGGFLLEGASREVTISLPTNGPNRGLELGTATVEDSQITGDEAVFGGGGNVLRRVTIVGGSQGIVVGPGSPGISIVESSTVRTTQPDGSALSVFGSTFGGPLMTLVARNVTAFGSGSGSGARASGLCGVMGGPAPAALVLRSVILRGFGNDLMRSGEPSCLGNPSPGSIDVAHSIYDPAKVTESGPGAITQGAGNLNVDPLFADPGSGNFLLTIGSPAIDAGDPAELVAGESSTDVAGSPRITDGDGDGAARRDIGAFEAPTVVPTPVIERTLKLSYAKRKHKFKGKLKSPEPSCRLDDVTVFRKKGGPDKRIATDGTTEKGKWSVKKRAKAGKYYATVDSEVADAGTCEATTSKTKKVK